MFRCQLSNKSSNKKDLKLTDQFQADSHSRLRDHRNSPHVRLLSYFTFLMQSHFSYAVLNFALHICLPVNHGKWTMDCLFSYSVF